ncbi:MAG: DUF3891 family protein [Ferruginibacter sp.]|nr:DUF3891 family protein [Cytophagales bacterium]
MIVNTDKKGWEIIYQQAHALLAAQLASHWRADQRPARWVDTLIAIVEHDDGQADWQRATYLNDAGAPQDFTSQTFTLTQLKRVTELTQYKGRWVALLVSMHLTFLYEARRGSNRELAEFLDHQLENQRKWRKELRVNQPKAQRAYALMQFCDRFSLILCRQELPTGERALEITRGPDGRRYEVTQRADQTLNVEPWPFEEADFTVTVEATYLNQLHFESDQQLLRTLRESVIREKTWRLVK